METNDRDLWDVYYDASNSVMSTYSFASQESPRGVSDLFNFKTPRTHEYKETRSDIFHGSRHYFTREIIRIMLTNMEHSQRMTLIVHDLSFALDFFANDSSRPTNPLLQDGDDQDADDGEYEPNEDGEDHLSDDSDDVLTYNEDSSDDLSIDNSKDNMDDEQSTVDTDENSRAFYTIYKKIHVMDGLEEEAVEKEMLQCMIDYKCVLEINKPILQQFKTALDSYIVAVFCAYRVLNRIKE